jgi:AraC-like DNA-binding protein
VGADISGQFFACPIDYAMAHDGLVYPLVVVEAPLATANPVLMQINERAAIEHVAGLHSTRLSERVAAALVRTLPSGQFGQPVIARSLNMSSRSLQRKLAAEGWTFRTLLDDTRRRLVQQHSGDRTLASSEIAYLLGFGDPSSLSRAMRRWKSRPPG